jgi:hypothetical protein
MSETLTLGKSRKNGQWIVLVQPDKPFGEHLDVYRKIAIVAPVNEDFSRVVIGKLTHSSPALNLITGKELTARQEADKARDENVAGIVKNSDTLRQKQEAEAAKVRQAEHAEVIEGKNAMIDQLRKQTKQAPVTK